MKKLITILTIAIAAVAAWSYFSASPASVTDLPGDADAPIRAALAVNPEAPQAGEETVLTFSFTNEDGTPTSNLMQHHTRKVHVVLVGEDRATLGHIHPEDFPELNDGLSSGTYKVSYTFPAAGRYIVAVDVANPQGSLAKQFLVSVAGSPRMGSAQPDTTLTKCFAAYPQNGLDRHVMPVVFGKEESCQGGYEVTFMPPADIRSGVPTELRFRVAKDGEAVHDLVPVMGAGVHFAIVPESFDTVMHRHGGPATGADSMEGHSHAGEEEAPGHDDTLPDVFGPELVSEPLVFSQEGTHTLFMEFKRGTDLVFGRFSFEVGEGVDATGETKMLMVPIAGGKLSAGSGVWTVTQGDMVMFHVMADASEELHVHGYDKSLAFPANQETTITFFADTAGRFPIELEGSKTEIGVLEVLPR